jgi:hypothetical protein
MTERLYGPGGGRGPRGRVGPAGPPGPPGPGGGGSLQINIQSVANNGDTVFVAPGVALGAALMFVNGVNYEPGNDFTVTPNVPVGSTTFTWLNVPFVLNGAVLGPADSVMFLYWI